MYRRCHCPFCAPGKLPVVSWVDVTRNWRVWALLLVLLLRGPLSEAAEKSSSSELPGVTAYDPTDTMSLYSQKIHLNESKDKECAPNSHCYCYAVGKCKRCSRFEIGRQVTECLLTGYKQRSYCPAAKKEKYLSCHYERDPEASRNFWLFEGLTVLIGALSYSVVHFRRRRIEKMVARRIQQQINA